MGKHALLTAFNGIVAIFVYADGPWQPHAAWAAIVFFNAAGAAMNGYLWWVMFWDATDPQRGRVSDPEAEELGRGERRP